jgi:hypothetical protein
MLVTKFFRHGRDKLSSESSDSSSLSTGSRDKYRDTKRRHRKDSSDSYERRHKHRRDRRRNEKDSMASHPYFINKEKSKIAKKFDDNGNELFWDGF